HPEGFVLYCGNLPHAVFITDVEGDTIYCCDPDYNEYQRTSLASSWLGVKYGSQSSVLSNTTATWYVKSYSISNNHTCNLSGDFKWFLQSHPHHNCYACSICGKVNADTSSSNYYDACGICTGYPDKPTLTVYSGSSTEDIMFLSSVAERATSYDFKVYNPTTDEMLYGFYGEARLSAQNLPAGDYYAKVVGVNDNLVDTDRWWGTYSDPVYFTVTEGSFEVADSVEYNGHRYELYLNRLSWQNAKAKCEELGGHLATITSAEEQEIVATIIQGKGLFIGATNLDGSWKWITGEEFSYSNWADGEPNDNGNLSENYLGLNTNSEWNDFDFINQNVVGFICEYDSCDHSDYTVTNSIEVTCTDNGYEECVCNECGEKFTIETPALGHDYDSTIESATCTSPSLKVYICSNCGDRYTEELLTDDLYSEWSEVYPEGIDPSLIEEKTQYRYSIKETSSSTTSSNLEGWIPNGSTTSYGDWNNVGWTATKPTETNTLRITDTKTVTDKAAYTLYKYYRYVNSDGTFGATTYGYNGCYTYQSIELTYQLDWKSNAGVDLYGSYVYNGNTYLKNVWIYNGSSTVAAVTHTEWYYQTRPEIITYNFYRWSDYSNWQDEVIYEDDNTKVETRTVYRYLTNTPEPLGHSWSEWTTVDATCTENGANIRNCVRCGETESEVISALGHSWSEWTKTDATCTENGANIRSCTRCGEAESETILATGHTWSEWIVTKQPTTTSEGEQLRYCTVCKVTETEKIPMIEEEAKDKPVLTVDNYTFMLTMADSISHIRYAKGIYETAGEIKNAVDCVDLSSSVIAKNTADGIFNYEMADGGVYSLWVKMTDGTTYIMTADLTVMEQEVDAYGVTVMVKNLYGVKDYFIAKGEHTTYAEVKANSVVQITKNKIGTKHDYTYILSTPGTYTVCIRYDDTTRAHKFITFEVEVSEPVFSGNGLQLTVGNLDDIKVIRTAYGEYNTPGDVKRAAGTRAFTGKTVLKGLDEYTIQYRESGTVTVAVVYNNGYEVMYTYEVVKKVPNFISSGKTVIIGDLDGLNLVRYAEGKYASSNQIKNAPGSKVIKSDSIVGGYIILELEPGTYTFCVQYDDESYNYYTVVVE
ncbi:MAG: hypothetical protein IKU52_05945, partial [Clostridia bacterium]|nr:hypothetical protein [Clostridia bacterium]